MQQKPDTIQQTYTKRLGRLENKKWKSIFSVQTPYIWNLKRLEPGKTLDIGCGIGRNLSHLPKGSIGIDHNKYSIEQTNARGFIGFLPKDFMKSRYSSPSSFDAILLSHVLEHMDLSQAVNLVKKYLPFLKKDGKVIVFCPQEKGYKTDETHVVYMDFETIKTIMNKAGLKVAWYYSFPFPRIFGRFFKYNEFVIIAHKT